MICKRCEGMIPGNARKKAPYCRHCYQAIQQENYKRKALEFVRIQGNK